MQMQLDDIIFPYTFDLSIFNENVELVAYIQRVGVEFYKVSA
jgi:hypothetical protein